MLGLVAFAQLVAVGVALGLDRQRGLPPQVVERVEYVTLPIGDTPPRGQVEQQVPPVPTPEYSRPPAPGLDPQPLATPAIADPVVERLVKEAQEARVADDMRKAIVKLEEAAGKAPDEPNVLYQFAQVFEAMGVYDKAEDYYQRVFELGTLKAGGLYELAAHKLSHGFLLTEQMQGRMALGRVRQFFDKRAVGGERVILTIPVLAAPGQQVEPEAIEVSVSFFDKAQEEVVAASPRNAPEVKWVTKPLDWQDGSGEELLQVTYFVPEGDARELHLFGQRKYFGQLVELNYLGELVDSQAWPRTLASKVNARIQDPLFLPEEFVPEEYNPENPLLPPLPR
jgi:tetratricopeptide (TPR) repeat protein